MRNERWGLNEDRWGIKEDRRGMKEDKNLMKCLMWKSFSYVDTVKIEA